MNTLTYADPLTLVNPYFFIVTKELFDLESEFTLKMPDSKYMFHVADNRVFRDSLHHSRRYEYPWVYLRVPKNVESVLDVGGGTSFSFYLSQLGCDYTILDINPEVYSRIRNTQRYTGKFNNVNSITEDFLDNSLPDHSYDCSVCISTIEHMGKGTLLKTFRELRRVTKLGGKILVTMDISKDGKAAITLPELDELCSKYDIQAINNSEVHLGIQVDGLVVFPVCVEMINDG